MDLERMARRRFVKAAILTSATLVFSPELAFAKDHGPACINGGMPCMQCRRLNFTFRPKPHRVFNPWRDWMELRHV